MVKQNIVLHRFGDWNLTIFYDVDPEINSGIVMEALGGIQCPESVREAAFDILSAPSSGFTYSNIELQESVVAITRSRCPADFANTLAHELQHVVVHIAKGCGINWESEDLCYIRGDIAEATYSLAHTFLCPERACHGR